MGTKTKSNAAEALGAVRAAAAAAKTLADTEHELREQHLKLLAERKSVEHAFASEGECIANANRLVDEHAARWAEDNGSRFVKQLGGHLELPPDVHETSRIRLSKPRLPRWGDLDGTLTFNDLCGLLPGEMKARMAEVVRGAKVRFGLPAEERKAKLAELDNAIADLEEQHTELVDAAAAVSIVLPLLDAVRKRREAAAEAEARQKALAEQRDRGQFFYSDRPGGAGAPTYEVRGLSVGGRG